MSLKGRTKFTIAGTHPLLGLVRTHFIQSGLALVPWDEDPDFCLIGAGLVDEIHPPLAQLELQLMQVRDKPVLLLSSNEICLYDDIAVGYKQERPPMQRASCLYAMAAEHLFLCRDWGQTIAVRPHNVYGPDITWDVVHDALISSRRQEALANPKGKWAATSFIHQDDFLKALDLLREKKAQGTFNVGSNESITYGNLLRNIWKFVNGAESEPEIDQSCDRVPIENEIPRVVKLHKAVDWLPTTSLRSGLFRLVNE